MAAATAVCADVGRAGRGDARTAGQLGIRRAQMVDIALLAAAGRAHHASAAVPRPVGAVAEVTRALRRAGRRRRAVRAHNDRGVQRVTVV